MAFNGTEGGEITLQQGAEMTSRYRAENPDTTIAHFFGKDILRKLLDQDNSMGIRMYYGIDEDGAKQLVLVGVDSDGNDLTELVADLSFPCPNACSDRNPLNS